MASRAAPVELDFLGLRASGVVPSDAEHHYGGGGGGSFSSSSIRGLETSAIARIDPQLLRRVVVARPPPPAAAAAAAGKPAVAPMTVFYNGSVAVFDVSHYKAEALMQMAADVNGRGLVENFSKDMPLARTKSLQQFLVKRKERLTRVDPYQLVYDGARTDGAATAADVGNDSQLRVKGEEEEEA